jgi:hypothetical protein
MCIPYAVYLIKKQVRTFILPEPYPTAAQFLDKNYFIFTDLKGTFSWPWSLKGKGKLPDHHHCPTGYATVSMASFYVWFLRKLTM